MNWITPFAYIDDAGDLHLCCDKVCEDLGWPKTEENLRIVHKTLIEQMAKACPTTPVVSDFERQLVEQAHKVERE